MYGLDALLSADHIEGIVGVLLIPVTTTLLDYILNSLFDRKVFEPIWAGSKKKIKAWRTKRNKITADYEYSIYFDSSIKKSDIDSKVRKILTQLNHRSDGDFEVVQKRWSNDGHEVDIVIKYKDNIEPYELTLNFIPEHSELDPQHSGPRYDALISSLGVCITFRFEFGKLRNSIIDLMLFARFLRDSVTENISERSVTDGRFVVSPIDNDLTLDDWIKKEQFDVSLLLESEDSRSSVEFHSDRAVISSPHTAVDDDTVEYIRATLLNYYL